MAKPMGDMRTGYSEALVEIGATKRNVVVVGGDTTQSVKTDLFGSKYPERFFNVGIAESNIISVAAGLALSGKVPFASTYAAFIPGKCVDQIRNTVAYAQINVKIVVSHAGLSVGPDGGSHQQIEDIAIMRAIPHIGVIVPSDEIATRVLVHLIAEMNGPVYMRLARPKSPLIYEKEKIDLKLGKSNTLRDGSDVTVIACGLMVAEAMEASDILKENGISCRVIDMFTIKPVENSHILKAARDTGFIVTAEEHNIYGGLGSAVAEVLGESLPTPIRRIGVKDTFGESGEHDQLLSKYGLKADNIVRTIKELIKENKR